MPATYAGAGGSVSLIGMRLNFTIFDLEPQSGDSIVFRTSNTTTTVSELPVVTTLRETNTPGCISNADCVNGNCDATTKTCVCDPGFLGNPCHVSTIQTTASSGPLAIQFVMDLHNNKKSFKGIHFTYQAVYPCPNDCGAVNGPFGTPTDADRGECILGVCHCKGSFTGSGCQDESEGLNIIYVAVGVGAGAVVLICLIILLVYWSRRRALRKEIESMAWVIGEDDILFPGVDCSRISGLMKSRSTDRSYATTIHKEGHNETAVEFQGVIFSAWKVEWYSLTSEQKQKHSKEIVMLRQLNHANVVSIVGLTSGETQPVYILKEMCSKGSLEDMIYNSDMSIDSLFLFSIASDIAQGLVYLHKSDIGVHGHINADNCHIDSRWTCKITGFGVDFIYDQKPLPEGNRGYDIAKLLLYTAPELMGQSVLHLINSQKYLGLDICKNREPGHHNENEADMEQYAEKADEEETIPLLETLKRDYQGTVESKKSAHKKSSASKGLRPEFNSADLMSASGDIWGFGLCMKQLRGRCDPFYSYTDTTYNSIEEVVNGILNGEEIEVEFPDVETEEYGQFDEFMKTTLSYNPFTRPNSSVLAKEISKMNPHKGSIADNMSKMLQAYANNLEDIVQERTDQLMVQTEKVKTLLYEILPQEIADQLLSGKDVAPDTFESVTIFFSDIVGFTNISAESKPLEVVELLNSLYTTFDTTLEKFDVYKVETIGDAYMVVSGVPRRNGNEHADQIANMALELLADIKDFVIPHMPGVQLQLRVGIHSGGCAAGVVGVKMPRYCLFGDTVNTASRMESNGLGLRIHMSSFTQQIITPILP